MQAELSISNSYRDEDEVLDLTEYNTVRSKIKEWMEQII